ncbi:MAG: DUF2156 domain-containing protein [bacterium]|nr:DUF2156 domain-containing protein [bacterium]
MHTLTKFSLGDKETFEKAYSALELPLAEHNFNWLVLWSEFYQDMEWAMINNNLCLFATFEGNRYVWGPPLGGDKLQETLDICFELCEEYNKKNSITGKPELLYLPEEFVEDYSKLNSFTIKHQNQDYIYKVKELTSLEGGKHKKKRNLINGFLNQNKVSSEVFSAKHEAGCLELLDWWKKQKEQDVPDADKEKQESEAEVAEKTIKMAEELKLKGLVVFIDGKIEGFTFGEKVVDNMGSVFIEKTNLSFNGLSAFIFTEFARKCFGDCEFINAGEDWDVEYLKKIKMSYHPEMLHKSYSVLKS